VLCFSRAAEQGHPDGQGTDDGAVSTAGPGCRMLDAGCWMLGATAGWIVMVRRRFMTNPLCMHSRHWHEQRIKDEGPDPETH